MIGILFLVAGLILDLAGKTWFTGAHVVGVILLVVGAVLLGLNLLMFVVGGSLIARFTKKF